MVIQGYFVLLKIVNLGHSVLPFFLSRLLLRMAGMRLDPHSSIHSGVVFFSLANLSLGARSTINFGCLIDNRYRIKIGSDVSIAHKVRIYTQGHDVNASDFAMKGNEVAIGDRACIFAGAYIMPGVELGEGAVVYPGAIVTKSVEPYAIVAGVPARVIGYRNRNLDYRLDARFWFMI
ncbi:acyltransferase [Opitutaceae bacterium TAV4]|nr:acyltransferase [Opitutaceae bacterium TAV4]RRJ97048.1 acyltransferase [Opitutaceae bacterium TAV4]RRK01017.1 acyltransferase [Opitutaceae bacterium TAV3]